MAETCLRPGTTFASHVVQDVLGQGGFGITYRVQEVKTGHVSALKEYFPTDDAERFDGTNVRPKPNRRQRFDMGYQAFLEEARTLNGLPEQRGLVRIKGAFEKHSTVYALMDFIDGEPLDRATQMVLKRHKHVPVVLLQDLVEAMLSALRAIHEVGVLHRDIKPGNVMIRRDGQPILIDFGTARPIARSTTLASMFSRRYAALEQFPEVRTGFRNRAPDTAAIDMFAFSVMLYELISQSLPPDAEERFKTQQKTGRDPYTPVRDNILRNRISASYPDALLDVVDAGCRLFPEERLRSADEMAARLDGFIPTADARPQLRVNNPKLPASLAATTHSTATPNPKQKQRHSGVGSWIIAVIILLLAASGVTYGYMTQ